MLDAAGGAAGERVEGSDDLSANEFFLVTLLLDNNIKSLINNSINLPHAQILSWLKELY